MQSDLLELELLECRLPLRFLQSLTETRSSRATLLLAQPCLLLLRAVADYVRHPMYGGLLMAAFGLAVITRSETRLAMAALLWVVLEKKVRH